MQIEETSSPEGDTSGQRFQHGAPKGVSQSTFTSWYGSMPKAAVDVGAVGFHSFVRQWMEVNEKGEKEGESERKKQMMDSYSASVDARLFGLLMVVDK